MDPKLSIVFPAYDERERLPSTLERIAEWLGERCREVEIVVVDDGSKDGTGEVAGETARRLSLPLTLLRHEPNRGKGFAARRGMLAGRGDALLLTDADLSVPIEHLEAFEAALAEGPDAVIGSRHLSGSDIAVHQPLLRERLGSAFRVIAGALVAPGVSDFTCGFKLFRRAAAREVFGRQRLSGWGYDVEILVIARRLGLTVRELPVSWFDDRRSRVRLGRDVVRSAVDLLRIRGNDLLGRYGPGASVTATELERESRT